MAEVVVNWLQHDWENRFRCAYRLLQKVPLGLIPAERLKELITDDILGIPECKALLDLVMHMQQVEDSTIPVSASNPELFAKRGTKTVSINAEFLHEGPYADKR